jgi:hypothetical protein
MRILLRLFKCSLVHYSMFKEPSAVFAFCEQRAVGEYRVGSVEKGGANCTNIACPPKLYA